MNDLLSQLSDFESQERTLGNHEGADILLDARVALEQATRWIPASERLPEPHTHFLALNRNGYVFESCMCYGMHEPWFTYPRGDGNASNTAPGWIDVTHWMPKPDLPQIAGDSGS